MSSSKPPTVASEAAKASWLPSNKPPPAAYPSCVSSSLSLPVLCLTSAVGLSEQNPRPSPGPDPSGSVCRKSNLLSDAAASAAMAPSIQSPWFTPAPVDFGSSDAQTSEPSKKMGKKRVRISDADPLAVAGLDPRNADAEPLVISEQERNDSWWSAEDFGTVKDEVKRECKDHRRNQRYSDCLTDAYRSACLVEAASSSPSFSTIATIPPAAASTTASANHEVFVEADGSVGSTVGCVWSAMNNRGGTFRVPDESMVRSLTDDGAPRGLEVYSSRLHALRRQRHLQESKQAVFLEQARQQSHNFRDADRLALQARRASRWARSFAVLLGRADAHWAAANSIPTSSPSDPGSVAPVQANAGSPSSTETQEPTPLLAEDSSSDGCHVADPS